ncbi:hypothetical protein Dsin_012631 [Dipteronia sinensis]|uniref:Uncharacterized protein n=1 Tax=Dipteronia sinensis TaxID=43782 RepID=A0AAE0E877_9ROSI|nr:hypothetical protein Dsin_012631 [Dipteronia sinensis]
MKSIKVRERSTEADAIGDKEGNISAADEERWNLEEEVAKAIEMGASLGLDFNGNEEEIIEIISLREEEDNARMKRRRIGALALFGYNGWLENKEMMSEAIKGWTECTVRGTKGFVLSLKVKASKIYMKKWLALNKREDSPLINIEEKLAEVERKANVEGWTEGLRNERLHFLLDYWKNLRKEEQMWKQKSIVRWLTEADTNSKFFHYMANGRRRKKFIEDICLDEVRCSDPRRVREGVACFFCESLQESGMA